MGPLSLMLALPLGGFLINGILGSRLPRPLVAAIACILPALAFVLALSLAIDIVRGGALIDESLFTWAAVPGFTVEVALQFDRMTAVMCLVITGIGTLIHVYSIGYMSHDAGFARYFAYLNLFLFFMLLLVLGRNLLVLFAGWEGVGLASYLLIGFWFDDRAKTAAGLKAFVVNRVGDTGFVIAAILIYQAVGSFELQAINASFTAQPPALATAIALLLLLGACGKSAQIPLHVWLPDAMAGPTPVSALIHAATMVTAGIYLMARLHGLYLASVTAMTVVAWIGASTALVGATMAITQFNLKKVLAYSTISQLGLMVMACGVGAFSVALFHLFTHAFFKACLFLGAGAVLHALHGEEDMRHMGALARKLPFTFATFLLATLALCGIPPFAGFFSKDEILWSAWSAANGSVWLWFAGTAVSGLTACYMFRAVLLTFFGKGNTSPGSAGRIHGPPLSMAGVLAVLALGSVSVGFLGLPGFWRELTGAAAPFYDFLAPVLPENGEAHASATTELALMTTAVVVALTGILIAWLRYGRDDATAREQLAGGPLRAIVARGYFFDDLYDLVVVRFADWLSVSALTRGLDAALTTLTLRKSAAIARSASLLFARLQTGNVQAYAFYAIAGLAIALWWGAMNA